MIHQAINSTIILLIHQAINRTIILLIHQAINSTIILLIAMVNQQCSDEQIEVFCREQFEDGECDDLPLFNDDRDERQTTCIL